jgi:hypothetical protein
VRHELQPFPPERSAAERVGAAAGAHSLDGGIEIDNLYLAQAEKDQAVAGFVQALRGQWLAHYRLRRLTLFDFEAGQVIH